jgi:hypothetical protein
VPNIRVTVNNPTPQRISVDQQTRSGVRQIGITSDATLAAGTVQSVSIATSEGLRQSGSPITISGIITITANQASTSQTGIVRLQDSLLSLSTTQALTANMGYYIASLFDGKVQNTFTISTGNGLVGGGDFTTNRTISANDASITTNGVVRLQDSVFSTNTFQAATANAFNAVQRVAATAVTSASGVRSGTVNSVTVAASTGLISSGSPITDSGTITLSANAASLSVNGIVRLTDVVDSANTFGAATPNSVNAVHRIAVFANTLVSTVNTALYSVRSGTVNSVSVSTGTGLTSSGSPITGSGTISVSANDASTTVNGVVRLNDTLTSSNTNQALTANMGFLISQQLVGKVQNTTSISTTSPLSGGGTLSSSLTLSIQAATVTQNGETRLNDTVTSANIFGAATPNAVNTVHRIATFANTFAASINTTAFSIRSGTVNSVSVLAGTGLVSSGSPVTDTGSITLSANDASTTVNGVVRLNDTLTSTNTNQALTANMGRYLDTFKVSNTDIFAGSTTRPGLVPANTAGNGQFLLTAAGTWVAPPVGGGGGGGDGQTITVASNVALALNPATNVLSTIYNTSISDSVDSIAVGGAAVANAAVWKTRNVVQVLDTILFPDVLPTYTNPTISFSGTVSGTQEIGSTITQTMTSTGTKNDANTFTAIAFRRGGSTINTNTALVTTITTNVSDQFGYTNPNKPNFTYLGTNTNIFVVVAGSTSWDAQGNYLAGFVKKNNKGVDDVRAFAVRSVNAPQAACTTFTSSSTSVTGIYPYFWGLSAGAPTVGDIATAIAAGTTNKVLTSSSGTVTVTFGAVSQYVWMAHIATDTSKTKWYNTALNNGDIGPGQFILSPVLQNVNSPDGYWTSQSFKVYISGFSTTTSGSIEFRNT